MNSSVRATATVIGITVFNTRPAILEWTPDGRFRITVVDPAAPPQVLFDGPPQALKRVFYSKAGQQFISFIPREGRRIRTDLTGTHLPPEPGESAASWQARLATTPVPPPSWWVEMLGSQGVPTRTVGWGTAFGIAGGVVAAVVLVAVVAAILG